MKFTLGWLKEHLETDATLEQICDRLTMIGLEVEDVTNPAETFRDFVIGEVLEAQPHPDADKLQVLTVDNGTETLQVVCGAHNARKGLKGVFAPVGTYVPGIDFTLKKAKIRGVESFGMMCSERELELSDDHEGIIDLQTDAKPGASFVEVMGLNDPVVEIYITPNRPDALGVIGVARDLAAVGLGKLVTKEPEAIEGEGTSPQKISLEFSGKGVACPVFAGRVISGVKNGPSPEWLQKRLKAIGLRPINALVDITNYISYDRGRPLHVYDADKLKGVIHARFARQGESFEALDGSRYELDEQMCVIADDSGVLGLGGIMGGETTGCTEKTKNVFVESAWFDPINIAMTGRKLQLNSDARYRFERGVDPSSVIPGLDQATEMILKLCGGKASKCEMAGQEPVRNLVLDFPAEQEVQRISGMEIDGQEVERILNVLGFGCAATSKDVWKVSVPEWRPDVHGNADLVEEIIRIIGVDAIENTPVARPTGVARPVLTFHQRKTRRVRAILAACGMTETLNWSFIPKGQAELFGGGMPELELDNPISMEMSHMRPSLLPGLLAAASRNRARGQENMALFEIGNCYFSQSPEGQHLHVAGLRLGNAKREGEGRFWQGKIADVDLFDAKTDFLAVLEVMGVGAGSVQLTRDVPSWYHPGCAALVQQGPKRRFGYFGALHPLALKAFDLSGSVMGFEMNLSLFTPPKNEGVRTRPALVLSDFQAARRDFAFVVSKDTAAEDVIKSAAAADKKLITNVELFDVFEGEALGEGKKSLAIEVTLQPMKQTLTDKDIEAVSEKVIKAVQKKTGAELR